jgi:hypothetical protein
MARTGHPKSIFRLIAHANLESFFPPDASFVVWFAFSVGCGLANRDSRLLAQGAQNGNCDSRCFAGYERFPAISSPWMIAVSVMLATFMEVLDTSIASVALPHIAGSLSATNDEATWVLTSYLVANAVILPASSWFALRFGRKRFLVQR